MKKTLLQLFHILLWPVAICAQQNPPFTWQRLTETLNPRGSEVLNGKPLQYNPQLNLVTFVHAASPSYQAAGPVPPATQSNVIVALVSSNWGQNWDSSCVWSNSLHPAVNPQAVVFNPAGNSQIGNAYIISSGATKTGSVLSGSWISAKQLGNGNYTAVAPGGTALTRIFPNTPPYAPMGKVDFLQYDATQDNIGRVRLLGAIVNNANQNPPATRGACILTGSVVNGSMVWSYDSILPAAHTIAGNKKLISPVPHMAWNDNGMVGYVWFVGKHAGAAGTSGGYQPIVYKTTNAGTTWSLYPAINFSLPSLTIALRGLEPVPGTNSVIPVFNEDEGVDGIVDMNDELHLFATLHSGASLHADSINTTQGFYNANDGETYRYPHTAGKKPYLFDFRTTASGWKVLLLDSLQTEAPGQLPQSHGYAFNSWEANGLGYKAGTGARLQLSKSANGRIILFAWADSDINVTPAGVRWNCVPNVYARMVDVCNDLYSKNKQIVTQGFTGVQDKAFLYNLAPQHKLVSVVSASWQFQLQVALSAVNNENDLNYTDSTNVYWFGSGGITFTTSHHDPIVPSFQQCILNARELGKEEFALTVFPNPVSDVLQIEWGGEDGAELVLCDITGKVLVKGGRVSEKKISLAGLNSGFYILEVWKDERLLTSKKILKE